MDWSVVMIRLHKTFCPLIGLGLLNAGIVLAAPTPGNTGAAGSVTLQEEEPQSTKWGVVVDNDALISATRDKDYTGGIAVNLSGRRIENYRVSLNPALSWLNRLVHVDDARLSRPRSHLMQFGLMLFTPAIDSTGEVTPGDRPFANLLFVSNSQFWLDDSKDRAYQSSLTVGILGSAIGEAAQNAVHRVGDFSSQGDYGQQISDGGELTARYALSRQSLLLSRYTSSSKSFELKYLIEGDVGYLTQGSATLAARWGRTESPWWSFAPARSNYLPLSVPYALGKAPGSKGRDFFFWGAITARARAYNAFLQGQFKDSEVTYSSGELNYILGEFSVGVTKQFGDAVAASFSFHYQTKEVKDGIGSRNIQWGGLTINKSF